nr:MAG TPA: hypothetical protein [Caudoviricetes sp.]
MVFVILSHLELRHACSHARPIEHSESCAMVIYRA